MNESININPLLKVNVMDSRFASNKVGLSSCDFVARHFNPRETELVTVKSEISKALPQLSQRSGRSNHKLHKQHGHRGTKHLSF